MSKPKIYTSEQGFIRVVSCFENGDGMYYVFHNYINHQLGIIDGEDGKFKPSKSATDTYLSTQLLTDLIQIMKFLKDQYEETV